MSLKSSLRAGLGSEAAATVGRRLLKNRLRVLAFHDVPDAERFESQMRYLATHYTPVAPSDVEQAETQRLPADAVLVTFDDGDRTVAENAAPVLKRFAIPGLAFVVAGLISTDEPYWWDVAVAGTGLGVQIGGVTVHEPAAALQALKSAPDGERRAEINRLREALRLAGQAVPARHMSASDLAMLHSAGVQVGHHSLTHPCLDQCDSETLAAELQGAHHILEELLRSRPRYFAYPNGNLDVRAEQWYASNDYALGFLFDHRLNRMPLTNLLRISRIRVDASADVATFRSMLSGVHPGMHRLRGGS